MIDIDEIMEMIYWDSSTKVQEAGILLGSQVKTIGVFIQPVLKGKHPKGLWGNSAKIISTKSDEELDPYLLRLLEWLEDLTWPGAIDILDRLKCYKSCERLAVAIQFAVRRAAKCDETNWIKNMSYLLENENLKSILDKNTVAIMVFYNEPFSSD